MPIRIKVPDSLKQGSERSRKLRLLVAGGFSAACILIAAFILLYFKIIIYQTEPALIAHSMPEEEITEKPDEQPIESSKIEASPPTPTIDIDVIQSPIATTDFNLPSVIGDNSLGGGLGGGGIGSGGGTGSGEPGMGSRAPAKSAFVGQLWDFKRTSTDTNSAFSGAANSAFDRDVLTILSRFYNGRWQTGMFSPYKRLPTRLFTTAFYMPNCLETEAMHAYDPQGRYKLQSGRWVAIYKAHVQAPVSGRFRFVGIADSVMAVRFNGKNVLECGLHTLSDGVYFGYQNETRRAQVDMLQYDTTRSWNEDFEGNYKNAFMRGEPFTVEQGRWYEMEVLISEIGGMQFGFCLLLDDMDDDDALTTEDEKSLPIYQLFRTVLVDPTADSAYAAMKYSNDPAAGFTKDSRVDPPYDPDSLVWPATNAYSDKIKEEDTEEVDFF